MPEKLTLGGKSTVGFRRGDQTRAFHVRGVDHEAALAATFGLVHGAVGRNRILEMHFSRFDGMIINGRGGSETEDFSYVINPGQNDALKEMHSRIKRTIATAVRRREKWRTLWRRGVTTRPGRL
ncbi:hypothetical protein [Bradyrhizobium erythrophlei]|uniref:hypothetical protein n=1 Tax=Bradyrhizobium erythrophlei TaxID=1437360 RepID=UPI0015613FD6|nr:hypothetical protein [Bradyrhizobium erythrophlei]